MKKIKIFIGVVVIVIAGFIAIAADHIDAPNVTGGTSDITDLYVFQGENTNNLVFAVNVQGLLSPIAASSASFDENVMYEFNIDTNGDAIEDLVIQAVPKNSKMYFVGPIMPSQTGTVSVFEAKNFKDVNSVQITPYGSDAIVNSKKGISMFAGPRDDPFFFDFAQFSAILGGSASGFNNPGMDTFAGTNVLSIIIEVPKSMLGGGESINTWVETKRK